MKKIYDRFKALIQRVDADGNKVFPEIEGALCVLEAPLGRYRDWNVHLNVFLVVRGFCDYAKLRQLWHWDVEFRKLPTGDVEGLRKSFRELIKYAVLATSEKSEHHAARDGIEGKASTHINDRLPGDDRATCALQGVGANCRESMPSPESLGAAAPPMLAWTAAELAEWLMAMHGFRRTRSYGCLYGAPKPEAADLDEFVWIGSVRWRDGGYRVKVRLLDSIPEDKSGVLDALERWKNYRRRVIPPPDDSADGLDAIRQPLEELISCS